MLVWKSYLSLTAKGILISADQAGWVNGQSKDLIWSNKNIFCLSSESLCYIISGRLRKMLLISDITFRHGGPIKFVQSKQKISVIWRNTGRGRALSSDRLTLNWALSLTSDLSPTPPFLEKSFKLSSRKFSPPCPPILISHFEMSTWSQYLLNIWL